MSDEEHEDRSEENPEESDTKGVTEEEPQPDVLSDYRTEGGASE